MSTYGIATYRPDGSIMMDGLSRGGVFIEILNITGTTTGSKSYPNTTGGSLFYYVAVPGNNNVSLDTDANGFGRINWSDNGDRSHGDTRLYVFASKIVGSNTYGILVVNDQGETLADQGYPAPQYIDSVVLNTNGGATYTTGDGYTAYVHYTQPFTYRDTSDKFVIMAIPDSGTNDTWYSQQQECIAAGAGQVTLSVVVYSKTANYKIPSLHIFAINHPVATAGSYGLQIYDGVGNLTFDSSSETIVLRDRLTVAYANYGSTNTYTLTATTTPGVSVPFFYRNVVTQVDSQNSTTQRFVGAAKRVGSQITFSQIMDSSLTTGTYTSTPTFSATSQTGRYCPVVELAKNSPSNPTGAGGGTTLTYPSFTVQPQSAWVKPGTSVSFTASATGTPTPTLQWYKNNVAVQGQTGTTYAFTAQQSDNGASIRCLASNTRGQLNSSLVTLTVSALDAATITAYSISPSSTTAGTTVTLSMTASGTQPLSLAIIDPGSNTIASGTGTSLSKTITASSTNGGYYTFTAANSDAYGNNTSDAKNAILTVSNPTPVSITQNPQGGSVAENGTFRLYCNSNYGTNAQYQWYKIYNSTSSYWGPGGGSDNGINADTSAIGSFRYYCVVTAQPGNTATSTTVTLDVNAPPPPQAPYPNFSTNLPSTMSVQSGSTASFSVAASPATSYTWYKNGVSVGSGTTYSFVTGSESSDTVYCLATNAPTGYAQSSTASTNCTVTVTAASQATYPSYNNFSATQYASDNVYEFDIYSGGTTSLTTNWANGTGDGSLYRVSASGNFTPAPGSFALNTSYDFATYGGVNWNVPIPPPGAGGGSNNVIYTLSVTVYLKSSGASVASGTITVHASTTGNL